MKKHFVVVCLAALGTWCVRAEIRPACTVTFADLPTIANHVASLGRGTADPILTQLVPSAIRNQVAAKFFGPMSPGSTGVAVCYVDAARLARLVQQLNGRGRKPGADEFDRAKWWSVLSRIKHINRVGRCAVGGYRLLVSGHSVVAVTITPSETIWRCTSAVLYRRRDIGRIMETYRYRRTHSQHHTLRLRYRNRSVMRTAVGIRHRHHILTRHYPCDILTCSIVGIVISPLV